MSGEHSIKFLTSEHLSGVIPNPVKANRSLPNYFKDIAPMSSSHPQSATVKRCVPFLDAMSSGFIIPMWSDVFVTAKDGEISVDFPQNSLLDGQIASHDSVQVKNHPLWEKPYGQIALKWINPWVIETQPGVSCLFTSPMNHLETRFKILDGVVDTDTYYNNVNFPFLWTGGDGEFLIKKGTPLVQVIPFARSEFSAEYGIIDKQKCSKTQATLGSVMNSAYRENYWHKARDKEPNEGTWPIKLE